MSDEIWAGIKLFINDTLGSSAPKALNRMLNEGIIEIKQAATNGTNEVKVILTNGLEEVKALVNNKSSELYGTIVNKSNELSEVIISESGDLSGLIINKSSELANYINNATAAITNNISSKIDLATVNLATQTKLVAVENKVNTLQSRIDLIRERVHGPEIFMDGDLMTVDVNERTVCNLTGVVGTLELSGTNGTQTVLEITVDGEQITDLNNDRGRIYFLSYGTPAGSVNVEGAADFYIVRLSFNDSIRIRARTINNGQTSLIGYTRKAYEY